MSVLHSTRRKECVLHVTLIISLEAVAARRPITPMHFLAYWPSSSYRIVLSVARSS